MKLSQLSALEAKSKRSLWRVTFSSPTGPDACPTIGQAGVSLDKACEIADRLEALSALYGFSSIAVVDETLRPVFAPHEPHTPPPPPPPPPPSRIHRLAAAEGIDLDLLVNPDALDAMLADTITIKAV